MGAQLQAAPIESPVRHHSRSGEGLANAGSGRSWRTDSAGNASAASDVLPAAADLHRMRRLVAVQNHLLDLLAEERDAGEVLAGVASLLEMPLMLFDAQGTLLAKAGRQPALGRADRLWCHYMALRREAGGLGAIDSADERLCFHEVTMLGRVERVLVAAIPRSADFELAEMALAYLERLLSLEAVRERDELLAARRMRSRLLEEFLAASSPAGDLALRLEREGISADSPWRVVVCELSPPPGRRTDADRPLEADTEERLIAAAERLAARRGLPQLVTVSDGQLIALVVGYGGTPETEASLIDLRKALQGAAGALEVRLGCSCEKAGLSRGARALHEAREALTLAQRQPEAVALFDQLCGRYRVIDGQSDETLADIYERSVGRLAETDAREHTRLLETLAALLDNQLAVQPTADALYIHRNTLQKRLHRIERLLGVDLSRLDDVVELYLGLRSAELLGRAV